MKKVELHCSNSYIKQEAIKLKNIKYNLVTLPSSKKPWPKQLTSFLTCFGCAPNGLLDSPPSS